MVLHGLLADPEPLADLAVAETKGDLFQHLELAGGEPRPAINGGAGLDGWQGHVTLRGPRGRVKPQRRPYAPSTTLARGDIHNLSLGDGRVDKFTIADRMPERQDRARLRRLQPHTVRNA